MLSLLTLFHSISALKINSGLTTTQTPRPYYRPPNYMPHPRLLCAATALSPLLHPPLALLPTYQILKIPSFHLSTPMARSILPTLLAQFHIGAVPLVHLPDLASVDLYFHPNCVPMTLVLCPGCQEISSLSRAYLALSTASLSRSLNPNFLSIPK